MHLSHFYKFIFHRSLPNAPKTSYWPAYQILESIPIKVILIFLIALATFGKDEAGGESRFGEQNKRKGSVAIHD